MGSEDDFFVAFARIGKQARTKLWGTFQVGVAVLVLVVFLAIGGRLIFGWLGLNRPDATTSARPVRRKTGMAVWFPTQGETQTKALRSTVPLPSEYGAFAVKEDA